jgi:hypothetical protein
MNTFWLKIAGIVVAIVVVVIIIGFFTSSSPPPPATSAKEQKEPPAKTIYEQWERDDKKLRAEPKPIERPNAVSPAQPTAQPPAPPLIQPKFKELELEEDVEAQQKWEWVVNQRKMARLPVITYKQMVDTCREIIRRWPGSKYDFMARRALADLPEHYQQMYNITKKETDLSSFYK